MTRALLPIEQACVSFFFAAAAREDPYAILENLLYFATERLGPCGLFKTVE
jgi:hypothetical protein